MSSESAKPCAISNHPTPAGCQTTFCAQWVRTGRDPRVQPANPSTRRNWSAIVGAAAPGREH